jgi:hypothetical protein
LPKEDSSGTAINFIPPVFQQTFTLVGLNYSNKAMATLQQVHSLLQQLNERSQGDGVSIQDMAEMLEKTPESVRQQVYLLNDLKFAKVIGNGETVILTETGLLAKVETHPVNHGAHF